MASEPLSLPAFSGPWAQSNCESLQVLHEGASLGCVCVCVGVRGLSHLYFFCALVAFCSPENRELTVKPAACRSSPDFTNDLP